MFRRSRFSIRPNVGAAGRAAGTSQDAPTASQEASETPKDISESSTAPAATDNKSVVTPSEKPTAPGDGNDQNGEGTSTSAALQRRKRFSIKPKVAPGRLSTLSRTPKSPAKAVSEAPVSDLDKPTTSSQTGPTVSPRGLQSPRRRRPSEDSKQLKLQPKPTIISSDGSAPSTVPLVEDLQEQTHLTADSGKQLESTSGSPVKEAPSRLPDKVPPSLPDKEAIEISEKAKTLVSSESSLSLPPSAFSLSRLLNDPSDMQRIAKAQKLRELLKQEMHKEKKRKKNKVRVKEFSLDPAKMTMRDLIRYLPESNPMTSSVEETVNENETVVPPSPEREASPERAQEPEAAPKVATPTQEEDGAEADGEAQEDPDEDEDAVMVPQVKVAEDGTLIIDEESLTVEVQRAKGPNLAQERDPIFERGSTTTYSSFRKGTYSRPWSGEETDMFFLAISMVGTDFSMICQLFPHRARSEIKNKFKKEERENSWRVDKAFRERRKLDIEYFSKLLEKILEVQKNRKKLKSLANKNSPKKQKRKAKSKKATKKLSDVEEENEEEENDMPDLEGEGEKENEALCNEGETPVPKPKKTRKRKKAASQEEPKDKKHKTGEKGNEQDEACTPEDAEAALPEDRTNSDISEKTTDANAAKDATIKPAKLTRGRAPKPLLPLSRKWAKKLSQPSKAGDAVSDKGDKSVTDGASQEQENKDASPLKQENKKKSDDDGSSSEEEVSIAPTPRPTRYGRVPKPTKPLNYSPKEDARSSASESTPASPATASAARPKPKPKLAAKRARPSKAQSAQESKKPKLVTLRASQSDYSDEENEKQWEEEEAQEEEQEHPACGSSNDSIAPAFVPASLRSPHPLISDVEETMEELDILANMPDVLGISQDALCPDASCERAHSETGTAEPCEHQLDLLVDVIDFLSSEHPEVSEDQSYNEAAETLLTIGNLAHLSHPAQSQISTEEQTDIISALVNEHLEEEIALQPAAQEEYTANSLISVASGSGVTETVTTVELQNSTTDSDNMQSISQQTDSEMDSTSKSNAEGTKTDSPQSKRGRLSKVKPKPNLGRASRAAQLKSAPETSTERTTEETQKDATETSQANDMGVVAEETPEIAASSQDLFKDDDVPSTCSEIKLTEEESSVPTTSDPETQEVKDTRDSKSTDVTPDSHDGTTKSSTNDVVTSDTVVPDSQSQQDPASVEKSSGPPPVEELPDSQKEDSEDASASQTKKSRFQRVKPKPNLAQMSRSVRSRPQTTKDTVDTPLNPTPNPSIDEETVVVSPEPSSSPKKTSQSAGPASDSTPSLDVGSTLTQSRKSLMTEQEKTTEFVGGQEELATVPLDEDASENQNVSEAQIEPSREQATIEKRPTPESIEDTLMSDVEMSDVVTESQVEHGSNTSIAPVVPAEVLPVSQKQEDGDASPSQTRKSRFQRVRPKPNLALTSRPVRSKPQTTQDTVEEDSNSTPDSNTSIHEKSTVEDPGEPASTISTGTPSQDSGVTSMLSLDLGPSLTPTEEMPETGLRNTDIGVESGGAALHESSSEAQFEISREPAMDERPLSESTEELILSHVGKTESDSTDLQTFDSVVTELQVEQGSEMDSASIQETGSQVSLCSPHVEESPVTQKQESEDLTSPKTRTSRFQRAKPKPNVAQTSRPVRSKPQTTREIDSKSTPNQSETIVDISEEPSCSSSPAPDDIPTPGLGSILPSKDDLPIIEEKKTDDQDVAGAIPHEKPSKIESLVPSLELSSTQKPTEELSSAEEPMTEAGLDSSSESSQQSVPQRRQRFPKVKPKPNIGSSTRSRQPKVQSDNISTPLEQSQVDILESKSPQRELRSTEKEGKDLMTTQCPVFGPVESGKPVDDTHKDASPFDGDQCTLDPVLEIKSPEKAKGKSKGDTKVEDAPASQSDCKQESSVGATEMNTQPTEEPTAISDVRSSADSSTESDMNSILPTINQSTPDSRGHTQLPQSGTDSEAQSQDTASQGSETNLSSSQSSHHDQSEPTPPPPPKAPQGRRCRPMKPKPNLGRSRQLPKTQQAQTTKEAQADSDTSSEGGKATFASKQASEFQPFIRDPLEEALEHCITQRSPPVVAESSIGCSGQEPDNSTQDAPMSSAAETHSHPSLSLFPDMLSGQMPSDPDEPFFTLCLTEIPVCPSGAVLDNTSEPLSCIPATETSLQQQSDAGVHLTAVGGEPLLNVAAVSEEKSAEKGLVNVKDTEPDPAAHTGSLIETPEEPQGSTAAQPPKTPETVEGNDETKIPPTKQRPQGTTRRAKRQVKPNTSRKKRASSTATAKEEESIPTETNATEESELPGLSVQPREFDEVVSEQLKKGGNRRNTAKKALTPSQDPEESSSGARKRPTRGTRLRKPAASLSEVNNPAPSSDSAPAKAASKDQTAETPRVVRKRSTPEPVASTPNVERTSSTTLALEPNSEQTSSGPSSEEPLSASQSSIELFSSQQSLDSSSIEDATSVSQYFLSDIFTDVEEG
ncbi:transcription factor TFIIIB component B'' homolog isoform X2 [Notolabrus celidotus]|uniref:transcription factor TFIIIB component B'' homolog isoform X2 n=1 Tax=Notolabrus celidotus TaxID=1203425 RepID=UPI00148F5CD4|nr:transcription factor TFIIIB component B'' homolog isoform X2 [Notolabrus celidotus]